MTKEELIALAGIKAQDHGIDPALLKALCEAESSWNPWAARWEPNFFRKYVAPLYTADQIVGGATEAYMRAMSWGLGQVMGQTARELGFTGQFLSELCDPLVGLEFCCRKLKSALDAHVGQVEDALLRYNGGSDVGYPSRVLSHLATYKV